MYIYLDINHKKINLIFKFVHIKICYFSLVLKIYYSNLLRIIIIIVSVVYLNFAILNS